MSNGRERERESNIKKYFNSLVQEFIKDPSHRDITIVFKDYLGGNTSGDTLGNTHWNQNEHITWETLDGVKVPGSERTTYTYKYTISFLNNYKDENELRGTVVHEFAHLYLFSTVGKHEHDDNFYSKMDSFEDWLDRKWALSSRKDKGGDWEQHVDLSKRDQRRSQYPNQPRNDNPLPRNDQYEWYEDSPERKKSKEFNRLSELVSYRYCKTLTELENNWQTVKNSSLYNSNEKIKIWATEENIKEILDKYYRGSKRAFCFNCLNNNENHQSNCSNKCSKCNYSRLRNDSPKCHNINCENYCYDPKWDKEREEQRKLNIDNLSTEQQEYEHFKDLLKNSKDLATLEQNYQLIKNSSIYSKRSFKKYNNGKEFKDNKTELDLQYNNRKSRFPSQELPTEKQDPISRESNSNGTIATLVIVGITIVIFLLLSSRRKKKSKIN